MDYSEKIQDIIKEKIVSFIQKLGFEVFDCKFFRQNKTRVLKLLVDSQAGGINLQECADLNRKISVFLDREDVLKGDYYLEVSSPGLDRKFKQLKDFKRIIGQHVMVWLLDEVEGKTYYEGKIKTIQENFVFIQTKGKEIQIPAEKVKKAKQKIIKL